MRGGRRGGRQAGRQAGKRLSLCGCVTHCPLALGDLRCEGSCVSFRESVCMCMCTSWTWYSAPMPFSVAWGHVTELGEKGGGVGCLCGAGVSCLWEGEEGVECLNEGGR